MIDAYERMDESFGKTRAFRAEGMGLSRITVSEERGDSDNCID
jgi:hypothetical protein